MTDLIIIIGLIRSSDKFLSDLSDIITLMGLDLNSYIFVCSGIISFVNLFLSSVFLNPYKATFVFYSLWHFTLTIVFKISFKHDGNLCCETTICIVSLWIPICCCYTILPKNHFDLLINSCPSLTSKYSCHLWYFIRMVLYLLYKWRELF